MSLSPRERSPRARSRFFWPAVVLGSILLSACTQKTDTSGPTTAAPVGPPYLELSAHPRVGLIVWIHPEGHTVLIELDPHLEIPPAGGRLVTRDPGFTPQAVLEITGEPTGRFQPARVLGGQVALDQEAVAPGPALQEWGAALLRETSPASPH